MTVPALKNPMTYDQYRNLVIRLAVAKKTSGEIQSEERIKATFLNAQRMKRIDKTFFPSEDFRKNFSGIKQPWEWVVLAEAWCGDGAQVLPIIAKLATLNPLISLQVVLRDENPELMDLFLTDQKRAIPKLICLDSPGRNVLGSWGSRPEALLSWIDTYKKENPAAIPSEFIKNIHLWYARDKGISTENNLAVCVKNWNDRLVFHLAKT